MQTIAPHRWQLAREPRPILMGDRFPGVVWSQSSRPQ